MPECQKRSQSDHMVMPIRKGLGADGAASGTLAAAAAMLSTNQGWLIVRRHDGKVKKMNKNIAPVIYKLDRIHDGWSSCDD